jgi:hypothetical protein
MLFEMNRSSLFGANLFRAIRSGVSNASTGHIFIHDNGNVYSCVSFFVYNHMLNTSMSEAVGNTLTNKINTYEF